MGKPTVRLGQGRGNIARDEFSRRFQERFLDPAFDGERAQLARLEDIAWKTYQDSRKAPRTRPAGPGYADPSYALALPWLEARARIDAAHQRHRDPAGPTRVLLVCASPRNDDTCPGEMSKTFRLCQVVEAAVAAAPGHEVDLLDLSLLTSEPGRSIHPCKGCVSTAMPLCHWPCSCYPNPALAQDNDWMNEIYERFTLAHAVILITPVHFYQAPSVLKLMVDRLVCADGGNPDPTSTAGKDAEQAKALELAGWPFPKHLEGRAYGVLVHGDAAGTETLRRSLCDWLDDMGLVGAGAQSCIDRYIGYYEPYADSHHALDRDDALHEEVRNVARAVLATTAALRRGEPVAGDRGLHAPRPK
jgi:multimeric flavodoxin WrbA